ncbi:MAG: DUF1549 and DUF1553 domain-containing protein [Pirellulaceae bacterium]|nr:DUF1549 and DUF1553 domain-containing protein [Pirellulaceae bacterium]
MRSLAASWILLVCGASIVAAETPAIISLAVEPAEIRLRHDDETVQLVVLATLADGSRRDVTREAKYAAKQPLIAVSPTGQISPQANGTTSLDVTVIDSASRKTLSATAPVTVADFDVPRSLHFATDILPLLTKHSCNAGGCHGKAIGQNGFKLSLFGFDPEFDHAAIVHESHGRRVSPAAPDDSLLLRKAAGGTTHGGGLRFTTDSSAYRTLRRWLVQGAAWGAENAPRETRLEVFPQQTTTSAATQQQLRVVAHYADGTSRDVTLLARYDTQQLDMLTVGGAGLIQTIGRVGEADVMIRYGDLVTTARFTLPLGPPLPDAAYAGFRPKNFIDELVLAKWKLLHVAPSGEATDAEFLRRAMLDTLGTLPTPDEIRAFLADPSAEKRDRLIDALLERPEYAHFWAQRWSEILRNRVAGDPAAKANTIAFTKWIHDSLAANKPYSQFVREILTASGKRADQPQMDWYRQAISNPVRVEDTAQAFLGMRVSCANCHNHPFENLSQTDYWRFAAFFARVGSVTYGQVNEITLNEKGVVKHPRSEQELSPQAFGGPEVEYVKGEDPRQKLADWLQSPENPYFARALVNRVWGHYLDVGLVDPVDDLRATNPPSNPELLNALAADFIAHQFDLKHLQRTIMKSRVYGLSSIPTESHLIGSNVIDKRHYSRHFSRRIGPYVLFDAISAATGSTPKFDDYADIKRAIELPNEKARSDFLDMFGRSGRDTPCECETSLAPNLSQVLYLLHSEELQRKIADKSGTVAKLIESGRPNAEIVEELFLRTFSRLPTTAERDDAVALIEKGADRKLVVEDLLWTLLNSNEFLFSH